MFIASPFRAVYAPGTDDAHHFDAIIFKAHGVRDQDQQISSNHTDGLPALLTVFNSILDGNSKRVIKYARSVHKPDAMLSEVEVRFLSSQ
jgi:hypothetical protein